MCELRERHGLSRYPRYQVDGAKPLVRAMLELRFRDGITRRIVTNQDWSWRNSPRELIGSWRFGNYGGERVHAGVRNPDWSSPGRAHEGWADAPQLTRLCDAARHTFESLSLGGYIVDCAHRERWGYGGDAHATIELGLIECELSAFYRKWLDDWAAIQDEFGNLPFTAPTLSRPLKKSRGLRAASSTPH
jgi:hypothetical protein